jgi:hypothetical protein
MSCEMCFCAQSKMAVTGSASANTIDINEQINVGPHTLPNIALHIVRCHTSHPGETVEVREMGDAFQRV